MDEETVRRLVKGVLGEDAKDVQHQPFGHHSVTYDVALPNRRVMVRMHPDRRTFEGTAHNFETLRALGVPVPDIVRIDTTLGAFPFAYSILERIEGRDLRYELAGMTAGQIDALVRRLVQFQRAVGQLPVGDRYGWATIGSRGAHSWWAAVVETNRIAWPDSPYAEPLRRLLVRYRPTFDAIPPTCFLDDITTKNVIVHNGALAGIVDLDVVCYGDPMYMLGLTATAVIADLGPGQMRYVEALRGAWEVTESQYRRACLYSALLAMDFIGRDVAASAAWTARMNHAIERWMAVADQAP